MDYYFAIYNVTDKIVEEKKTVADTTLALEYEFDHPEKDELLHVFFDRLYRMEVSGRGTGKWAYYKETSPFDWKNLSSDGKRVLSADGKKTELDAIAAAKEAEK